MTLKFWYLGKSEDTGAQKPLAEFDDSVSTVSVGRDIDCNVSLPEGEATISRKHFGIKLSPATGSYKYELSENKPVYRNGFALFDGDELSNEDVVRIGKPDGPVLRIRVSRQTPATNFPITHTLKADGGSAGRGLRIMGMKVGKLATASLTGGVVLLAGLGYLGWGLTEQKALTELVARSSIEDSTAQQIAEQNREAVYLVAIRRADGDLDGMATAFAILHPKAGKVLATNAHVAELKAQADEAGFELVAVPVGGKRAPLKITGVQIHPGYEVFDEFQKEVAELQFKELARSINFAPSYDVALMTVESPESMSPIAELATAQEISDLKAGAPLMMIGYPAENLIGTDSTKPEPTVQKGAITSVTNFMMNSAGKDPRHLVQHSIPATGGASGSPIFNRNGHVVALLNAGNMMFSQEIGRIPSAALVNYAQRSDLLMDLTDEEPVATKAAEEIRKRLAAHLPTLMRSPAAALASLEEAWRAEHQGINAMVVKTNEPLSDKEKYKGGDNRATLKVSFKAQAGKKYSVFAASSVEFSAGYFVNNNNELRMISGPSNIFAGEIEDQDSPTPTTDVDLILFADGKSAKAPETATIDRVAIYEVDASSEDQAYNTAK